MTYENHVQRLAELARQAEKIAELRRRAEQELLDAMQAQAVDADVAADVYLAVRGNTTSSFPKAWKATLRTPMAAAASRAAHRSRRSARAVPNGPGGAYWTGVVPLRLPAPMPLDGTPVVYILFDDANTPCYLGSTGAFQTRLSAHIREGKPVKHWMAIPCSDRQAAYRLEAKLLQEHKLPLNIAVWKTDTITTWEADRPGQGWRKGKTRAES